MASTGAISLLLFQSRVCTVIDEIETRIDIRVSGTFDFQLQVVVSLNSYRLMILASTYSFWPEGL